MTERVAVLLGAGASADAGLPLTVSLAERVVVSANATDGVDSDWVRALNFVYGSMVGYASDEGNNPLAAVNIERLISALRLLQVAKSHEAAPFVAAWKSGALGLGSPSVPNYLGSQVISALSPSRSGRGPSDSNVTAAIARLARAATQTPGSGPFRAAEEQILLKLRDILSDVQTVDYLTPLAELAQEQAGGLDVITLNYDLTIERLATETGTPIDRGIERWSPGVELTFDQTDGQLNLYKLHGSLDWELDDATTPMGAPSIIVQSTEPTAEETLVGYRMPRKPWIVVGEREKLSADGPMLALLRAAENALRQASHLVVAGYSFADPHINSLIRDWLLAQPGRTIGILEMTWRPQSVFLHNLIEAFGSDEDGTGTRVVPVIGTARDMLETALKARPQPTPAEYFTATVSAHDDDTALVELRLEGMSLTAATVSASSRDPEQSRDVFQGHLQHSLSREPGKLERPRSSYSDQYLDVGAWSTSETIQFYVSLRGRTALEINIQAVRADGTLQQQLKVAVAVS